MVEARDVKVGDYIYDRINGRSVVGHVAEVIPVRNSIYQVSHVTIGYYGVGDFYYAFRFRADHVFEVAC